MISIAFVVIGILAFGVIWAVLDEWHRNRKWNRQSNLTRPWIMSEAGQRWLREHLIENEVNDESNN